MSNRKCTLGFNSALLLGVLLFISIPTVAFGTFIIPEATITIDGDTSDWIGLLPVFTDAENDQDAGANFDGTDIKDTYLAIDDTYLYLLMTLYDGDPKTDIHTQYGVQFTTDSNPFPGTHLPGDLLAKAGFGWGDWYAGVHQRGGGSIVATDIAHYGPDYVGAGSNAIEWRVLLSDMGSLAGQYVWSYTHTFTVPGISPGYPDDLNYPVSDYSGVAQTAPVPEPATMLLFGTGLAGLAGYRRRKAMKK